MASRNFADQSSTSRYPVIAMSRHGQMYSSEAISELSRLLRRSPRKRGIGHRRRVILVERHSIYRQHIPFILLSRALARHHIADPITFRVDSKVAQSRLPRSIRNLAPHQIGDGSIDKLFRACGITRAIHISSEAEAYLAQAVQLAEKEIVGLAPRELELVELDGVLLGDLLYDDFLSLGRVTVDTSSPEFFSHCASFMATALAWQSFFRTHDVKAVVTNHVYRQGVPARIANHLGIDTYEAGLHRIARITSTNPPLSESTRFREMFGALDKAQKQEAFSLADRALEEYRSETRVDHTNWHLPARQPNSPDISAVRSHQGKKIMLALHCLSDSPHVRGRSIFPDYATWIRSTLETVQDSNVLVVIKPHPACPDTAAIRSVAAEYSNYVLVDARNPLSALASAGISLVVTFFGNIAFEAALLGLDVMNMTYRNPHSNYQFGFVPSNEHEYRHRIMDSSGARKSYPLDQLREYLYMSRLRWNQNLFFTNTNDVVAAAMRAENPADWLIRKFIEESDSTDLETLQVALLDFVAGDGHRFQPARD